MLLHLLIAFKSKTRDGVGGTPVSSSPPSTTVIIFRIKADKYWPDEEEELDFGKLLLSFKTMS